MEQKDKRIINELRELLKDWESIIKPVEEYIRKTGNPIPLVEREEE